MSWIRRHSILICIIVLLIVAAVAAMNSQNNLLFWVVGVGVAAILLSIEVAFLSMRMVDVRRLDPKHGSVGEPMVMRYEVTNKSRWLPVFNLIIKEATTRSSRNNKQATDSPTNVSEKHQRENWPRFLKQPRSWIMHIGPGETAHGEAIVWPTQRGQICFNHLRFSTRFPFGLFERRKRRSQSAHTLVFPRQYTLRPHVLQSIVPRGPLGLKLSARPGGGDDYFGLREYKPGDSRRQVAWKRSAGLDQLVIKERTIPSPPRLRIVLNLTTPTKELGVKSTSKVSPRRLEERAISLVATMISAAYRAGFEVGLSVLGCNIPVTPLRCSHWHVEKMMAALASIELDDPRTPADARALADAERAGLVVVHPAAIDPRIVRLEAWHFSAKQLSHLVTFSDAPSSKVPKGHSDSVIFDVSPANMPTATSPQETESFIDASLISPPVNQQDSAELFTTTESGGRDA